MCVDCVLASPRIAQVDPGDRTPFRGGSVTANSSLVLIFYLFIHSVSIHMLVTSLVSTHTTYRTLHVELILFAAQNTMVGTCVYFVHT
jgi:hypothetical protein